ncbi:MULTISPECIES: hypothetical protein [Sphingobacterium]|uniref:hypothetical protein n=1 Tax=Sphingobacterium TaxID=28453 RepID=UPI0025794A6B|nr:MULTISPECIES: hypothetical protein [Sphingobacterium]
MTEIELITNLEYLTVSRLTAISKLYIIDCSTSNVSKLHKALNKVINEGKRIEVKTNVEVEHDEIIDMFKAIDEAIQVYKIKYGRSTFPKDLNIYQLIDDFREVKDNSKKIENSNAKELIRELITDSNSVSKNAKKKSKTKRELIDEKKQIMIVEMKLKGIAKQV